MLRLPSAGRRIRPPFRPCETFPVHSMAAAVSDYPLKQFRRLYQFWKQRTGERRLPSRRDFLAEEFKDWMGHIAIVDVLSNPRRFRLRLVGTEVTFYDGADFTGRRLDEVLAPAIRPVILRQYDQCVDEARPYAFRYQSTNFRNRGATVDKLFLPLSVDGETVSQILVCLYAQFRPGSEPGAGLIQRVEAEGSTEMYDPERLLAGP